jgi:type II restriction enzyme
MQTGWCACMDYIEKWGKGASGWRDWMGSAGNFYGYNENDQGSSFMGMQFNTDRAQGYKSKSQIARVLTENWISEKMFCVRCGHTHVESMRNNQPVADFICSRCESIYELKSKSTSFGRTITDGDYSQMIRKVLTKTNPDFLLLHYDSVNLTVRNLSVIPGYFFVPSMVERRNPLPDTARRAGWVGCNLLIDKIPTYGKIPVINQGEWVQKSQVLTQFERLRFLEEKSIHTRTWLVDVMNCLSKINSDSFTLSDVYQFEDHLKQLHTGNNNIRAKIRQQLQVLRDKGIITFESRGEYRKL